MNSLDLSQFCYSKIKEFININNKKVKLDSRLITKNDIFIAIPGYKNDGRNYINQAVKNGASMIIIEQIEENIKNNCFEIIKTVPIIYIRNLKKEILKNIENSQKKISEKMKVIGITGTNGKTTVSHILSQWVYFLGKKSATLGSIGNGIQNPNSKLEISRNTTSSPILIEKFLNNFYDQNIELISMEISSHGLIQNRVQGLYFSAAIFTNFSRDHLDYHKNLIEYKKVKWKLFSELNVEKYIINIDDDVGKDWINKINIKDVVSVSMETIPLKIQKHWLYASKVFYFFDKTIIKFSSSWGDGTLFTKLLGKFNVYNILLALATLLSLGYPLPKLIRTSFHINPIPGRMETIFFKNKPKIIIDYAHNPIALKYALLTSKFFCNGKLWSIFGCGGDRDKGKRPIMGKISKMYSDFTIITNDNPRIEEENDIIEDIISGIKKINNVKIIHNRKQAIKYAISHAKTNDLILISGKGNERYQIFKSKKIKYSDKLSVLRNLNY